MKHSRLQHFARTGKNNGVKLSLWANELDQILKFELSGHAGFGEEGQDIVCAAISALVIGAINGLEHFMKRPPLSQDRDGYVECTLQSADDQELAQAQWIVKTMALALEEIKNAYGSSYLNIEYRRWTPC